MNNNPDVPSRPTEGSRPGGNAAMKRQPGRPRGSKNKPKSLVPSELAEQILLRMEDMLPEEHFRYLKGVIKDGKAISTIRELDTLILLLSRNLYPALVHEMLPAEEGGLGGIYRKDVTERLKILQSLLGLRFQIEKKNDDNADEGEQPILKVFAARGIDTDRLSLLVGVKPAELPEAQRAEGSQPVLALPERMAARIQEGPDSSREDSGGSTEDESEAS